MNYFYSAMIAGASKLFHARAFKSKFYVTVIILSLAVSGCSNLSDLKNTLLNEPAENGLTDLLPAALLGGGGLNLVRGMQGQSVAFADFDGDGIEDKIVGVPYAKSGSSTGVVLVYRGTGTGFSSSYTVLKGGRNFGWSIQNIGDVTGDGIAEFAVGAIHGSGTGLLDPELTGTVTVYRGGSSGGVLKELIGEVSMSKFGYSLSSGDLNGDNISDIIVGAPFNTNDPALYQNGAVYVFFGPDFSNSTALYGSSTNKSIGFAVASGDVNADGKDDLLISASKKVLVYYGASVFAPSIDVANIAFSSTASGFGKAIAVLGDLDGVTGAEIGIGAENAVITFNSIPYRDTGSVYVVSGTATGAVNLDTPPAELIVRIDGAGLFSRFGSSILPLGDIDLDGKADFAVGAPMTDVITSTEYNYLSGRVYIFKGKNISVSTTIGNATSASGKVKNQWYGVSLAKNTAGTLLLIGAPRANKDTGGVEMIDPLTAQIIPGGSSGGAGGDTGDCH